MGRQTVGRQTGRGVGGETDRRSAGGWMDGWGAKQVERTGRHMRRYADGGKRGVEAEAAAGKYWAVFFEMFREPSRISHGQLYVFDLGQMSEHFLQGMSGYAIVYRSLVLDFQIFACAANLQTTFP
jgi:hypothetical protein